jgi:hypothetical protein
MIIQTRLSVRLYTMPVFLNTAFIYTVEPGYNDIGLYETSLIVSDFPWYQLLRHS